MRKVDEVISTEFQDDLTNMQDFANTMYETKFASAFKEFHDLFNRMKSKTHPITDEELEWSLTLLPMELFNISETLNSVRLDYEVIKLKNKKFKTDFAKQVDSSLSAAAKNEMVAYKMVEFEIVATAYSSVITRVENEISFSREFIMGAKKIWDSRRKAEGSNPVKEVAPLPEYPAHNTNIYRGGHYA